jgi:hypothetical protein
MGKNQQTKKKHPTPAPKPADKKNKEKKAKQEKAAPQTFSKKLKEVLPPAPSPDAPFFQNELVKPLVYVLALVSLLSVIYLIMS